MTEEKKSNDPKKVVPAAPPVEDGPVVSQAVAPAGEADPAAAATPEKPTPLSQVPADGWSKGNLPKRT